MTIKMKILLLDNYDSFTYNLLHVVKELGATDVEVVRNDQIELDEVNRFNKIILSPGPGIPEEAGLLLPIIKRYAPTKSILGVCLGHQAIGEVFGGTVSYAKQVMHGKQSVAKQVHPSKILKGVPEQFEVARYHSLAIVDETIPSELIVTSVTDDGEVMSVEHKDYPIYGVQFHPESIMTPNGEQMIRNFLEK